MILPLPEVLFFQALQYGGTIDVSDGKMTITTEQLPEELQQEIVNAMEGAILDYGDEVRVH